MGNAQSLLRQRKDGSVFPIEVSLIPLHTESGLYVISIICDITLCKRYEQQLEEQMLRMKARMAELETANVRLAAMVTEDALTGIKNRDAIGYRISMTWHHLQRNGDMTSGNTVPDTKTIRREPELI